ncbi:MAG: hypothetical protein AAGG38_08310, partial [Planctomycetota bacterium]
MGRFLEGFRRKDGGLGGVAGVLGWGRGEMEQGGRGAVADGEQRRAVEVEPVGPMQVVGIDPGGEGVGLGVGDELSTNSTTGSLSPSSTSGSRCGGGAAPAPPPARAPHPPPGPRPRPP